MDHGILYAPATDKVATRIKAKDSNLISDMVFIFQAMSTLHWITFYLAHLKAAFTLNRASTTAQLIQERMRQTAKHVLLSPLFHTFSYSMFIMYMCVRMTSHLHTVTFVQGLPREAHNHQPRQGQVYACTVCLNHNIDLQYALCCWITVQFFPFTDILMYL